MKIRITLQSGYMCDEEIDDHRMEDAVTDILEAHDDIASIEEITTVGTIGRVFCRLRPNTLKL